MNLSAGDQTTYSRFARYVRVEFPKLKNNQYIRRALSKCGSFSDAQIDSVLSWGTLPTVKVVDFKTLPCGAGGTNVWGCTRKGNDEIEIGVRFVKGFETNMSAGKDNLNSAGRVVYVAGATILHELCHYGNFKAGAAEAEEMGLKFERMAYGKTIW